MKSMKKFFIGLAAVAAMGICALCFNTSKSSGLLKENVNALSLSYICAQSPDEYCEYVFDDETIPCDGYLRDDGAQTFHVCKK